MKNYFTLIMIMLLGYILGCGPKPGITSSNRTEVYFDKKLYPGQTIQSNGIEIYYEKTGNGPYVILIEGLGVETWLYEENIPELSKYFTTIVYDNRGVGHSTIPVGPYTIDMMVSDLLGLMDVLDIQKASLIGASMGGFIAMEFAIQYPERVEKLGLLSTTAGGKDHVSMSLKTLKKLLKAPAGAPREIIRDRLTMAYTDIFMADTQRVEHLIDLRLQNPQPKEGYKAQAAIGPKFDASGRLHTLKAHTFIGHGQNDILVPVVNAKNLHKKIPNSTLKIYEGLEHQFFVEDFESFNRDIIKFLKE